MPIIAPSLSPYNGSPEQNGQSMKRTLEGMAKAGEPLLREALDAIRAHQTAQDNGASPETIERLRVLADSLYHAVVDFQVLEAGSLSESISLISRH
jgi:hypothetical protein